MELAERSGIPHGCELGRRGKPPTAQPPRSSAARPGHGHPGEGLWHLEGAWGQVGWGKTWNRGQKNLLLQLCLHLLYPIQPLLVKQLLWVLCWSPVTAVKLYQLFRLLLRAAALSLADTG